jgi:hypothetical protein
MYDPLGSAVASGTLSGGFGSAESTPPWPTTPHTPNSPIPNLRPAPTPERIPDGNPFEKQAQIYGQPEPGLISPATNPTSNGGSFEKPEPYLRVRITGLDRNRRDILVRFDAQVRRLAPAPLRGSFRPPIPRSTDKSNKLHWNCVPQCVAVILRVSATLRRPHT